MNQISDSIPILRLGQPTQPASLWMRSGRNVMLPPCGMKVHRHDPASGLSFTAIFETAKVPVRPVIRLYSSDDLAFRSFGPLPSHLSQGTACEDSYGQVEYQIGNTGGSLSDLQMGRLRRLHAKIDSVS